jgi:hypothetical protein
MNEPSKAILSVRFIHFSTAVIAFIILLGALSRFYLVTVDQLKAPYDIFLEAHNLASIKAIKEGADIYSPAMYRDPPFIITIYNPLFHYLVAALPEDANNPFFTGRFVSVLAALLMASLLFVAGKGRGSVLISLLAVGLFFLIRQMVQDTAYLRCDTLGVLFSACAVVMAEKSRGHRLLILLTAILGMLAFATKQSFVPSTASCALYLFLRNRKIGMLFIGASVLLYGAFAMFAQAAWGSGYWFSTYASLLQHPRGLSYAVLHFETMLKQPLFVLLMLTTLTILVIVACKHGARSLKSSPYFLYLIISFTVLCIILTKQGADTIYFMEFVLACLLLNVFWGRELYMSLLSSFHLSYGRGKSAGTIFFFLSFLIAFLFLALLELTHARRGAYSYINGTITHHQEKVFDQARKELSELRPRDKHFLTLDSTAPLFTLQPIAYLNDPYNYWMMWNNKILDVGPLIRAIRMKHFSVIMFVGSENPYHVGALPMIPEGKARDLVFKAISENYVFRKRGVFHYFTPK